MGVFRKSAAAEPIPLVADVVSDFVQLATCEVVLSRGPFLTVDVARHP